MIAFNGLASQIIRLSNCNVFRGRETMSVGFWFRRSVSLTGTQSMWRHDGVFTPLQASGGAYRWVWWNTSNTISATTANFAFPVGGWHFGLISFGRNGGLAYRYLPGSSPSLTSPSLVVASRVTSAPTASQPMVIGGTEGGAEMAVSGAYLAELMVVRGLVSASAIPQLAHEPQRFEKDLLFYAPLRGTEPRTVLVSGRSYAFQYGSTSRDLISENGHPPVEKWRAGRRVLMGTPFYESVTLSLRARAL